MQALCTAAIAVDLHCWWRSLARPSAPQGPALAMDSSQLDNYRSTGSGPADEAQSGSPNLSGALLALSRMIKMPGKRAQSDASPPGSSPLHACCFAEKSKLKQVQRTFPGHMLRPDRACQLLGLSQTAVEARELLVGLIYPSAGKFDEWKWINTAHTGVLCALVDRFAQHDALTDALPVIRNVLEMDTHIDGPSEAQVRHAAIFMGTDYHQQVRLPSLYRTASRRALPLWSLTS
jgi:hypothetical protein